MSFPPPLPASATPPPPAPPRTCSRNHHSRSCYPNVVPLLKPPSPFPCPLPHHHPCADLRCVWQDHRGHSLPHPQVREAQGLRLCVLFGTGVGGERDSRCVRGGAYYLLVLRELEADPASAAVRVAACTHCCMGISLTVHTHTTSCTSGTHHALTRYNCKGQAVGRHPHKRLCVLTLCEHFAHVPPCARPCSITFL